MQHACTLLNMLLIKQRLLLQSAFPFYAAYTFPSYVAFALRQAVDVTYFRKLQKYTHFAYCYFAYMKQMHIRAANGPIQEQRV